MEYLSTKYGLVTDNDPTTENGQLFLAELILLKKLRQVEGADRLGSIMKMQLFNSKVSSGLYHRNPDLIDRRVMSHDNLTGIFAFSYSEKTEHRFEIWKYLVKHLGTYDNTRGKTKQLSRFLPFNPSNFFVWGLCAESKIYLLFLPFFFFSMMLSCRRPKEDTSGKILLWTKLYPLKDHWLCKYLFAYYEKKMINMYGVDYVRELMKAYHGTNSPDFPINTLLGI